jgi:acetolactate synthase-1/2/3 large subunit
MADMTVTQLQPVEGGDLATVGEVVAAFLEACCVEVAFGVISIHNMPMLDAIARRQQIRFVPARGEAGAANMADAAARVTGGIGVVLTSTGTGCGNAAGALIEAQTAGTPVLHLTGQIESEYLDREMGYIHEAADQPGLLNAVSKAAFRIRHPSEALPTLKRAVLAAMSAPRGPVSIEIPIDVQQAEIPWPTDFAPHATHRPTPREADIDALAAAITRARRPLIWAGGGARHCAAPIERLLKLGFGLVTSTQGRGVIDENDSRSLGAFNANADAEALYETCDAMLAVGTRLRGNETLKYTLKLPEPLYRMDVEAGADGRSYANASFTLCDANAGLEALADRLESTRYRAEPRLHRDIGVSKAAATATLRAALGAYATLVDAVGASILNTHWVRDVTISNSTWGNRLPALEWSTQGVHALGGGIGQSLAMGIGAAVALPGKRAMVLVGDGGLQLGLAELATAVEERANVTLLVMNSRSYGVIKNIQDAHYGGRHHYVDLHTPDFEVLCEAVAMPHQRLSSLDDAADALSQAAQIDGPIMLEFDMAEIGDFARRFDGPPVRSK